MFSYCKERKNTSLGQSADGTEPTEHDGNLNNQTVVAHLPNIVRGKSMLHRHVTKAFLMKG